MRRTIGLLTAALVAGATLPAAAADLSGERFGGASWAGPYAGAAIGYGWGRHNEREFLDDGTATGLDEDYSSDGFIGGIFAGAGWQWSSLYLGGEADIEFARLDGGYDIGGDGTDVSADWQGSLRARLGYAAGPVLLYATGGLAFADVEHTLRNGATAVEESFDGTRTGWTAGAGVDAPVTDRIFARVEYRYVDLGMQNLNSDDAFPGFTYDETSRFHSIRLGVGYRF